MKMNRHINNLLPARRKRGLSRKQVASLLGYKSPSTVGRLERGVTTPSLLTVIRLECLYRTPVAFLYPRLYESLRKELRASEDQLLRHRPQTVEPAADGQEGDPAHA